MKLAPKRFAWRTSPKSMRPTVATRSKTALRATFPTWRARVVLAMLGGAFCALIARAVYLQSINESWLTQRGEERFSRIWEVPASRGRILDRNNEILAVSTPVSSVWALTRLRDGTTVKPPRSELEAVAPLVGMPARELSRRLHEALRDSDRDRVQLNRQVAPESAQKLRELKVGWIVQNPAYRRVYPIGEAMSHVLGFTNLDDEGQEGIELAYQRVLHGEPGARKVIRDNRQRIVEAPESLRPAREGGDVRLAMDSRVQHIAYRALKQAVTEYRARGGGVIVIDVITGEVLALANLPTYDPNKRDRRNPAQMRNRAVTDIFEPGSTLKPFTIALALDQGKLGAASVIQTAPGTFTVHGATIRDRIRMGR